MSLIELPSNRDEAWRWSDLSALPTLAEARPRPEMVELADLPWIDCGRDGPRLLFVDGAFVPQQSDIGPITLGNAEMESSDHPLGRLAGTKGWQLRLGPHHSPSGLVQIIHVATGAADHLAASVALAEDAQASIVETFIGQGWSNRLVNLDLAKGARLMLSRRLLGSSGFVSLTDRATVGEGASLTIGTLAAGGADSRLDGTIAIAGEGGFAEVGGPLLAKGRQRHDVNLVVRHNDLGGMSRQTWRSVADGQAACSVAARVEVARTAQKTDAEQSLKGLLLSRGATINAKPELEIFADDVKCAHGATVGELDRDALFYLASRGVAEPEARALLTGAFVVDAIMRIGEEKVREAFHEDAMRWLG